MSDTPMAPRPKPAPPKTMAVPTQGSAPQSKDSLVLTEKEATLFLERNGQEAYDKANITISLPPINLESPDGERVVEVRDPDKAKSMVNKGWKVTDRKKTPFQPKEHLTDRPLAGHEGLAALQRSMKPPLTQRQKSTIRKVTKNFKEKK